MEEFIRVMKALSDPNRIKILKMLQIKPMCVCEIHTSLDLPQPTVSKNLKLLEKAGLVVSRKDGLWVNYMLADGASSPYASMLLGGLRHWLTDNPDIQRLAARVAFADREQICGKR
jgi:ArsR family transcriptional regulator